MRLKLFDLFRDVCREKVTQTHMVKKNANDHLRCMPHVNYSHDQEHSNRLNSQLFHHAQNLCQDKTNT